MPIYSIFILTISRHMDTDDPEKPKDPWPPRLANLYESKLPPSDRPKLGHTFFAGVVDTDTFYKVPCNEHGIIADPIWRRGIEPHTLLYDITTANILLTEFKDAARSHFSHMITVRLVSHNIGKRTIVEIVMTTEEDVLKYANNGITVGEKCVYGFPSLGPEVELTKVFLSKVPMYDRSTTVKNIRKYIEEYGICLEVGMRLSQGWFGGQAYALIRSPHGPTPTPLLPLSHVIPFGDDRNVYATWSKMPLHCSSCHKPGHRFSDCPERESRVCWRCNTPGHLRARCPKTTHRLKRTQSDLSDTSGSEENDKTPPKKAYLFTNPTLSVVFSPVSVFPPLPGSVKTTSPSILSSGLKGQSIPNSLDFPSLPNTSLKGDPDGVVP